jgi:hypothetical protein
MELMINGESDDEDADEPIGDTESIAAFEVAMG